MTTIEELLHTIEELNDLASKALDLVDEWGGEPETAEEMRERLEQITIDLRFFALPAVYSKVLGLDEHRKND
jgi:hypothetical protein